MHIASNAMSTVLGSIVCAGDYLDFSLGDIIVFAFEVLTTIIFHYGAYINTLTHVFVTNEYFARENHTILTL